MDLSPIVLICFLFTFWNSRSLISSLNITFNLTTNFSYFKSNQTSSGSIILDSKSLGTQVAFLSTNLTQYSLIKEFGNFLHLTWIDSSIPNVTKFKGFLDLSTIGITVNHIFYSSKIINLNPLNIFINTHYYEKENDQKAYPFLSVFTVNENSTITVVSMNKFGSITSNQDLIITEGIS